jgi:hypothetical protein
MLVQILLDTHHYGYNSATPFLLLSTDFSTLALTILFTVKTPLIEMLLKSLVILLPLTSIAAALFTFQNHQDVGKTSHHLEEPATLPQTLSDLSKRGGQTHDPQSNIRDWLLSTYKAPPDKPKESTKNITKPICKGQYHTGCSVNCMCMPDGRLSCSKHPGFMGAERSSKYVAIMETRCRPICICNAWDGRPVEKSGKVEKPGRVRDSSFVYWGV